jgi:hypothetical protein
MLSFKKYPNYKKYNINCCPLCKKVNKKNKNSNLFFKMHMPFKLIKFNNCFNIKLEKQKESLKE